MRFGILIFIVCLSWSTFAQSFINGGFEGEIGMSSANNPLSNFCEGWHSISFTDTLCLAIPNENNASADLWGVQGGSINSYPYEGDSFLAGDLGTRTGICWHEGVYQDIHGFEVDTTYDLSFQQAIEASFWARDTSGGWKVYGNDSLLYSSEITTSTNLWNSPNLDWEYREFSFIAWTETIRFKFLPYDDDTLSAASQDYGSALRMGLDDVKFVGPDQSLMTYEYFPNVFTPNNDGVNDLLDFTFTENYKSVDFTVLNRWGQMMYQSNMHNVLWDGYSQQGIPAKEGVYYWVLVYEDYFGVMHKKVGFFNLIK